MLPIRAGEIGTKFILEPPKKIILCTLQALRSSWKGGWNFSVARVSILFLQKQILTLSTSVGEKVTNLTKKNQVTKMKVVKRNP